MILLILNNELFIIISSYQRRIQVKKFIIGNFITRKSFFFRFLRSYLIVLLIPFTTILIMYNNAQKTIHEEILNSNANQMNQFVNILDMKLDNMTEKTLQILNSGLIRKQALYQATFSDINSGYGIYETMKYLEDFPQEDFSDVFVYFNQQNRIISARKSSLESNAYYDTYYRDAYNNLPIKENNYDAFLAALTPDTLVPELVSLGQEQTTPFLGVVLSMNYNNTNKPNDVTAVLVLMPELLKNLIQNSLYQHKGSIMIYDSNNKLLVNSDQEDLSLDLSSYHGNKDNIYSDSIHGEEYILQFFPSKILNCTYVSVISSEVFWEKLIGLKNISIASIVLSMLVSIILSWLLARRSYSPIDSIVHTIRNKSDFQYDFKKKNELDFIKEVIINTFSENDILSSRMKNSKNSLFEEFLLHAMQNTLSNKKYPVRDLEQVHLNFISDSFSILLINIDSVNEAITETLDTSEGQQILSLIVGNIMSELCAHAHKGFIINLLPKVYAVLLNYSPSLTQGKKQEEALEIVHNFQNFIKIHFDILSTISVSNPVESVFNLNIAYNQARKAMEYRYMFGKGSIIPYQEINNKRFTYNSSFNSKNSLMLIQYIKESAKEDVDFIINETIANALIDQNTSLSVLECFKYDIINTINKIIYEIGAVESEQENNYIHTLIHAETFDEFRDTLKQTLLQLKNFRELNKEQFTICDKAEVLIHDNYMDVNLNNSIIADKLSISPSYLSKLFKTQKNISLLDQLYQVRLSYAKNFLRETELTIEEIAARTGFISDSALIKTFKKYEGITPGSYRKLIT